MAVPDSFRIPSFTLLYCSFDFLNPKNKDMKEILLVACIFVAGTSCAQGIPRSQVPSVVLNTFQQRFSKASDVEWEQKDGLYEVEFDIGRYDHEVWINPQGQVVRHKQDIPVKKLPKAVKSQIKDQFAGYRIDDADQIDEKGRTIYVVEIERGEEDRSLVFDATGKLLEKRPD